jgi:multicomponent Na+:H+ antiporter subunit G
MAIIIDGASWALILAGSFFIIAGAIGMLRLPDLFTRIHAASLIETLGAGFLFAGLMLQAGFTQVTLKLLFILLLFFFTGPVITHALSQAALNHGDVDPELTEDRRSRMDAQPDDGAPSVKGRLP